MAQDTNEILQDSNADVLYAPDGHVYDGLSPIHVDNDSDLILLEPIAITKIAPTPTIHVTQRVNALGNREYELNVDPGVGKEYTGEGPIQVNNTTNKISVAKLPLVVEWPVTCTVTPTSITFGCDIKRFIAYDYNPDRQWRQYELCWQGDELYVCTNPDGATGTWDEDYWSTTTIADAIMAAHQ